MTTVATSKSSGKGLLGNIVSTFSTSMVPLFLRPGSARAIVARVQGPAGKGGSTLLNTHYYFILGRFGHHALQLPSPFGQ